MLLIQITAAHGPTECEYAARLTLRELLKEADPLRTIQSFDPGVG